MAQRLTTHVVLAELRTGKLPKDQADQLLKRLGRAVVVDGDGILKGWVRADLGTVAGIQL